MNTRQSQMGRALTPLAEILGPVAGWFAGIGLAILDRVCPAIPARAQLPYGFSRGKDSGWGMRETDVVRLLLPIGYWRGTSYLYSHDEMRRGWWLTTVMIAVLRVPGGFDVRFRAGHWARGNGAIKSWRHNEARATPAGVDQWYDEGELRNGRYVEVRQR